MSERLSRDDRPVRAKAPAGPLEQRVAAKSGSQRDLEQVKILREAGVPDKWTTTVGKTDYTLSIPDGIVYQANRLIISRVLCDPAPPIPLDPGPYIFTCPPILVPDGTVYEEPHPTKPDEMMLVPNMKGDPLESIRIIVTRAVFGQ